MNLGFQLFGFLLLHMQFGLRTATCKRGLAAAGTEPAPQLASDRSLLAYHILLGFFPPPPGSDPVFRETRSTCVLACLSATNYSVSTQFIIQMNFWY